MMQARPFDIARCMHSTAPSARVLPKAGRHGREREGEELDGEGQGFRGGVGGQVQVGPTKQDELDAQDDIPPRGVAA